MQELMIRSSLFQLDHHIQNLLELLLKIYRSQAIIPKENQRASEEDQIQLKLSMVWCLKAKSTCFHK
tara:strand:+ start:190 stop:390 length:201 start_codon:yes stop_codon:yes gene_type:complete